MQVLIVNESRHAVPRKFIQTWLMDISLELKRKKILSAAGASRELTLVFLDKNPAKKINLEFRGKEYATDVLSFESLAPGSLGELVLCPDVLKRQAKEHSLTYNEELGYMLLHGVLHLLGYDHETSDEEAKEMFSLQDGIFEKLLKKLPSKNVLKSR